MFWFIPLVLPSQQASPIIAIAISPDQQWLASLDLLNTIHVFNLDSMKVIRDSSKVFVCSLLQNKTMNRETYAFFICGVLWKKYH